MPPQDAAPALSAGVALVFEPRSYRDRQLLTLPVWIDVSAPEYTLATTQKV